MVKILSDGVTVYLNPLRIIGIEVGEGFCIVLTDHQHYECKDSPDNLKQEIEKYLRIYNA